MYLLVVILLGFLFFKITALAPSIIEMSLYCIQPGLKKVRALEKKIE